MTIRKIILLAVFTATMLTGCFTSSTSGGAAKTDAKCF